MDPDEITARAEPVGMSHAGEFVCPTGKCARPIGIQFLYDDGFNTPIVDMPVELRDGAGAMLVPNFRQPRQSQLARGML